MGVIPIGKVDWNAIKAEYIGGGISQRDLAKKHGVSVDTLLKRANKERWNDDRKEASNKSTIKAQQKVASVTADNATIAARIRTKLLQKLEKEIDALPDKIGSETSGTMIEDGKSSKGNKTRTIKSQSYKLRDLTAAYKDLTADMVTNETAGSELLQSLFDLERRMQP